jgi:hypothetical protein
MKWRSGVKHDAASIMEFTHTERGVENGFGQVVELEPTYLYPLVKGSEVGNGKGWQRRYVLVTQKYVGESTSTIREVAPKTWEYLKRHEQSLSKRASVIYSKNPQFSVFGVGPYAFMPWKIAICGLYKAYRFRLVPPIDDLPVIFDDTVYYLSFDSESEARSVFDLLTSESVLDALASITFWDEKRPIKASTLNVLDWSRIKEHDISRDQLEVFQV